MRVRQSPTALRSSWHVGRRAAGDLGDADDGAVSAMALTGASSGAA